MIRLALAALLAATLAAAGAADAIDVPLELAEGIGDLTGSCFIRGVRLSLAPPDGIELPPIEGSAQYGSLRVADGTVHLALDLRPNDAVLYLSGADIDRLAPVEWEHVLIDGTFLARPTLALRYEDADEPVPYRMNVMWNPYVPGLVTFCRDTYRTGEVVLGGRAARLAVIDEDSDGRYDPLDSGTLLIDTDGDGRLLATADSHERYTLSEPFWFDGAVYEVTAVARDGSWIRFEPSSADVPTKHPLLPGFPAPPFEALDADGSLVSVDSLRGRVIVLDFWAGWCTPCIVEMPALLRLSRDLGPRGVDVIGINIDRTEEAFRSAVVEHSATYRQIYDGPDGPIAGTYRVSGIPMVYVIDADGVIRARDLRGAALFSAVEALLEERESGAKAP